MSFGGNGKVGNYWSVEGIGLWCVSSAMEKISNDRKTTTTKVR